MYGHDDVGPVSSLYMGTTVPMTVSVEKCLSRVPEGYATTARRRFFLSQPPALQITPSLCSALKTLSKNTDILILATGKGSASVVLDRS